MPKLFKKLLCSLRRNGAKSSFQGSDDFLYYIPEPDPSDMCACKRAALLRMEEERAEVIENLHVACESKLSD